MAFDWGNAFRGGAQGGIIPGIVSGFMDDDPYKKAKKYLDQIPGQLKEYLMPYINAGEGALPHLNDISSEYENLYKDPNAIISRIGGGYKQSPGYQWRLNQGENAITNAQAAGGMTGTGQHQQLAGELAENLANQDYNDYMKNALGLFGTGLTGRTGIEQNIFNQGASTAGDLATSLANILKAKAGLSYQSQLNENQENSDAWSSLMSNVGKIAGFL